MYVRKLNIFNRRQHPKIPHIHAINFKIQLDSNRAGSYFTRVDFKKPRTINKILLTQTPKPEDLSMEFKPYSLPAVEGWLTTNFDHHHVRCVPTPQSVVVKERDGYNIIIEPVLIESVQGMPLNGSNLGLIGIQHKPCPTMH